MISIHSHTEKPPYRLNGRKHGECWHVTRGNRAKQETMITILQGDRCKALWGHKEESD